VTPGSKAETLRELHRGARLLVLPNAWDAASARAFAAVPGCAAIATTSAAVARALGYEDGEQTPVAEMIRAVGAIARSVEVPVSADLEAGYGDPIETARLAWDAGAVGMNLEDSRRGTLVTVEEQADVLRHVREAVPDLVLNARTDVFLHGDGDVAEAVERANAYLAAGADCAYPILAPRETWAGLAERIDGPVNVLFQPGDGPLDEIARLGIRRVTFGAGLANAALAEAERLVREALA
jgi:2-methylisocitrate lyase-like PEP mutase family enzyme